MQITIEDLSPVEKKVEFELPWADVAPEARQGLRLPAPRRAAPGFRPGKVPRALLERMYRRQVEDEVARELVERSLGQAIQENQIQPVAPPAVAEIEIKAGAPFKFSARVEVRSQVTPKDYAGRRRSPAGRPRSRTSRSPRRSRGTAAGSPQFKPVERARKETGDADLVRVEMSGKVGEHKIKKRELLVDLEDDAQRPAAGAGQPAARQADRRREPIEVDYTLPTEGVARRDGRARTST